MDVPTLAGVTELWSQWSDATSAFVSEHSFAVMFGVLAVVLVGYFTGAVDIIRYYYYIGRAERALRHTRARWGKEMFRRAEKWVVADWLVHQLDEAFLRKEFSRKQMRRYTKIMSEAFGMGDNLLPRFVHPLKLKREIALRRGTNEKKLQEITPVQLPGDKPPAKTADNVTSLRRSKTRKMFVQS
jgi:hypothetical protein